jgi:hypothetical protein
MEASASAIAMLDIDL